MRTLTQFLKEQMENEEFAKEYEAIQPELEEIKSACNVSEVAMDVER